MLSRVYSVGLRGVDGYPVLVELDLANGLPSFTTVGLPDSAVRESRERVTSAVRNSGFKFPTRKITVNLAPAQSRKQGTQFDLATALAVLSASGQLGGGAAETPSWVGKYCFVGELALDGTLRPVPGALTMALKAKEQGFEAIVVPAENAEEAAASGMATYAGNSLREVADFVNGGELVCVSIAAAAPRLRCIDDLADVKGQHVARRALEIAAAGGHNLLFIGPPGAGKTMLARRLPTVLPPLSNGERLELTRIYSAVGGRGLVAERPFRAPHHSASAASLIGGGPNLRPGEVSLAHCGVLFLDEVAEFSRPALESLRQPLEDHKVTISRARESLEFPARFLLVAASNPCPCGRTGHAGKTACSCPPAAAASYRAKLSGPLLDRIDLLVSLPALVFKDWAAAPERGGESSAVVRARVERARGRQRERLEREDFALNAYIPSAEVRRRCRLDAAGLEALESAAARGLSARGLDRVLRVARTIADLAGGEEIGVAHLREAIQMRRLEETSRVC